MHSIELITKLCAKDVLCHCTKVNSQEILVLHYTLYYLQCDWQRENSPQKVIVNET